MKEQTPLFSHGELEHGVISQDFPLYPDKHLQENESSAIKQAALFWQVFLEHGLISQRDPEYPFGQMHWKLSPITTQSPLFMHGLPG